MGMESPENSKPKVKLNSFGEIIENEEVTNENGYINEKGEFVRGKDFTGDRPASYINEKGEIVREGNFENKKKIEKMPDHLL